MTSDEEIRYVKARLEGAKTFEKDIKEANKWLDRLLVLQAIKKEIENAHYS